MFVEFANLSFVSDMHVELVICASCTCMPDLYVGLVICASWT